MHTMTTNDSAPAMLDHGSWPSNTYSDTKSQQITVIQIDNGLHDSTSIALFCKQKIPARKSSKTFSKVVHNVTVAHQLPESQPNSNGADSAAPANRRRSRIFYRKGAGSEQPMAVPKRTTSLIKAPRRRNRPDSVSLHNRGRKLFSSIDSMLALAQATNPPEEPCLAAAPTRNTSVSLHSRSSHDTRRSTPASQCLAQISGSAEKPATSPEPLATAPLNTIISWTSDETRLMEYEKIDRAHSGLRGFCKQLLPRAWCRGSRRDFFSGDCDGDSVRRYRMSIPEKIGAAMIRDRAWSCFT